MKTQTEQLKSDTYIGRLSLIMQRIGLDQAKLAIACKRSEAAISNMFRNNTELNATSMANLKKAYPEINMNWLLGNTGEMFESEINKTQVNKTDTEEHITSEVYYTLKGKFEYSKEINDKFIDRIENILTICEQQQHQQQHEQHAPASRAPQQEQQPTGQDGPQRNSRYVKVDPGRPRHAKV